MTMPFLFANLWQEWSALCLVALAIAYVARRAWRAVIRRAERRCGGCSGCGAAHSVDQPPTLVRLDLRQDTGSES